MTQLDLIHPVNVENVPDLVHRVRHLRFFTRHISHAISSIAEHEALSARFDTSKAAHVFLDWVQHINQHKASAAINRRDYIVFSAGTLLTQLLARKAIDIRPQLGAVSAPKTTHDDIIAFWPEGFVGVSYCLTVLDTIFNQEGMAPFTLQPCAYDLHTWWSFKENFEDNPWVAVAVLDHFIGQTPNWITPSVAASRPAMRPPARADNRTIQAA